MFVTMALFLLVGSASASENVLFILDVSGSMKGKMNGEVKMDAAKSAFRSLIAGLPKDTNVGLEVYGHHGDKDCSVIELMNPVAPLDATAITANVEKLTPIHGATPMAAALERGAEALQSIQGNKAIVLLSDGKENCGGDPTAVAAKLKAKGIDIITHVVGLGVNEEEKAQLAAIAKAGGGQYFAANNADELKASLAAIKKKVLRTEAIFRDDFDGDSLDQKWEVVNPEPDSVVVEDGYYKVIAEVPEKKLFNAKNMLLYKGELPKEWDAEMRVLMTQMDDSSCYSWHSAPFVGLILKQDDDNAIVLVSGRSSSACNNSDAVLFMRVKNGKWVPGYYHNLGRQRMERLVRMRLRRMQRKFTGFFSVDDGKTWQELGSFTILRSRMRLGVMAARGSGKTHPMLEKMDWVELRKLRR